MSRKTTGAWLFLGCLLVATAGGSPRHGLIVLRDIPESPTFVVWPSNPYYDQVAFANDVEGAILAAGVAVMDRSGRDMHVTDERKTGMEEGDAGSQVSFTDEASWIRAVGAEAKHIEWYAGFQLDADTDYIVVTYAAKRHLRIIRRASLEVIASFRVPAATGWGAGQSSFDDAVAEALEAMGIAVKRTKALPYGHLR